MRLWVDYTNWKGRRAWREIEPLSGPEIGEYFIRGHEKLPLRTWIMHVRMIDRGGARRTLNLTHIRGFAEEEPDKAGLKAEVEISLSDIRAEANRVWQQIWNEPGTVSTRLEGSGCALEVRGKGVLIQIATKELKMPMEEFSERLIMPQLHFLRQALKTEAGKAGTRLHKPTSFEP